MKLKLLLLIPAFLLSMQVMQAQTCPHSVELSDEFGDGWNGGVLTVQVNTVTVLSFITLDDGFGPGIFYFDAATGDVIDVYYSPGNYAYENEYVVKDALGNIIGQSGQGGGNTPTNLLGLTGNCPACMYPTGLTAMYPTTTTIQLDWNAVSGSTGYNWEIVPIGNGQGNGVVASGHSVTNSVVVTGLSSATAYDAYVQNDCSSIWSDPARFTTDGTCGMWSIQLSETYGDGWDIAYVNVYVNGNLSVQYFTLEDGIGPVVTYFGVDDGDIVSVDFAQGYYSEENEYKVFNQVGYEVAYEGEGGVTPGDIGDYTIPTGLTACLPCPDPSLPTVSNITSTAADLSWTENGSATLWDIEYGEVPYTFTGTPTITGVSNPFSLTGLDSGLEYTWKVRASCGTGSFSEWIDGNNFTTLCDINTTYPMTEDFEGTFLPGCWSKIVNAGNDITQSNEQNHTTSGTFSARFSSYDAASDYNQYLFTKQQTISASYTRLSFWHRKSYSWSGDLLYWGVASTTDPADYTWTAVTLDENWQQTVVDLSAYIGQNVYIGFHYYGDNQFRVYLDDLKIEEDCPPPTNLTATNITPTSTDLAWTENGSSTTWNIEYGPSGFTLGTGTQITGTGDNPYSLSGLSAATSYDWYVQAVCGVGEESVWVGPSTFATSCGINSTFPMTENFEGTFLPNCWSKIVTTGNDITQSDEQNHTTSGSYSARFSSYNHSTDYNQYLFTQQQTITAPYTELSFWHRKSTTSVETLEWGIASTTDPADYTWTSVTLSNTEWNQTVVDLSAYVGQDVYIGFHYFGDYAYYVYVDDLSISEPVTCPTPTSLFAGAMSPTWFDLSWTETGSSTSWNIEYGPSGFTLGTGIQITGTSDNPYSLTGLALATEYQFYVQSVCGVGDESTWAGPCNFATPPVNDDCPNATALTVGYTQNWTLGTNAGATDSNNNPDPIPDPGCGGYAGGDVWYSAVVPATGTMVIDSRIVTGSNFQDAGMAYYTGNCGALILGECDDDDGAGWMPQISINNPALAGQTIYIRIWDYDNDNFGSFEIEAHIPSNIWTGNVDSDWHNAGNWSAGVIPDATMVVTIPTVPAGGIFPVVNVGNTGNCLILNLEDGSDIEVSGTLNVGN